MHGVNLGLQSYKGIAEKIPCSTEGVRESKMLFKKIGILPHEILISHRIYYVFIYFSYEKAAIS